MLNIKKTIQQNISQHIQNVYEEGELEPGATHKKFLLVRKEGSREVKRNIDYYNLDMIISVGYRVKSLIATRFRIWATERLKEYIIKGFTMDNSWTPYPQLKWGQSQQELEAKHVLFMTDDRDGYIDKLINKIKTG